MKDDPIWPSMLLFAVAWLGIALLLRSCDFDLPNCAFPYCPGWIVM